MYMILRLNELPTPAQARAIENATGFPSDPVDRGKMRRDEGEFRYIDWFGYSEDECSSKETSWEIERIDAHRICAALKALKLPMEHEIAYEDDLPHRATFAECEWCNEDDVKLSQQDSGG